MTQDIHIVTSQQSSEDKGYMVHKIRTSEDHDDDKPLLIGHLGEYHYVSLSPASVLMVDSVWCGTDDSELNVQIHQEVLKDHLDSDQTYQDEQTDSEATH